MRCFVVAVVDAPPLAFLLGSGVRLVGFLT